MTKQELGFDPNLGTHTTRLTHLENRFLGLLWTEHSGFANAISAANLAMAFLPDEPLELAKREVRKMHNHLLFYHSRIPLLSKAGAGGGYWVAENADETEQFYYAFRSRGLTGMRKASRGKQSEMVGMVQQLSFEFDDLVDKTTQYVGHVAPRATTPTPVEVVDAFLEKMMQNPEKFADGLRKIGAKYGSVLLPKYQVSSIRKQVQALQEAVDELE